MNKWNLAQVLHDNCITNINENEYDDDEDDDEDNNDDDEDDGYIYI